MATQAEIDTLVKKRTDPIATAVAGARADIAALKARLPQDVWDRAFLEFDDPDGDGKREARTTGWLLTTGQADTAQTERKLDAHTVRVEQALEAILGTLNQQQNRLSTIEAKLEG